MTFHHSEENAQVWALECFDEEHPGSRYLIEFADGEAYVGELETAYDSDNAGELGIEMDDPLYHEFHQVIIKVFSEVSGGLRVFNGFVTIDYRDFPVRITERSTGQVIYGDPPAEVDR